ncbi:hypothetical protein C1H46_010779 [Malus baccata]|uniref:Uncharacterized protein n=1 Tax=Malus baccata TaxID=106549 RepID=A0A540MXZ1_MALBA|nr:hypothetical protein C1H46_010779 [Malus baccata]
MPVTNLGCNDEIVTIIAMLHAGNIFYRPSEKQSQADQKKAKFLQPEGDHLTLLTVKFIFTLAVFFSGDIYNELVMATKEYMHEVSAIDPKWLMEQVQRFFKAANPTKLSNCKRQERIEPLYDRYHELNSWRLSRRRG